VKRSLPVAAASLLLAILSPSSAETIFIPGSDEAVPAPEVISVRPYSGPSDPSVEPGSFVVIRFLPVPEAVAYRIYREMYVRGTRDSTGTLRPTNTPEWQFVPWGSVPPFPGVSAIDVVMASLGDTATRYGVATEVIRDGELRLSPLTVTAHAEALTAIPTDSWGAVKHLRERRPR